MNNIKISLVALGAALVLASCGGGGSDPSPGGSGGGSGAITGLAATGAALGGANITAKCAAGAPISSVTDVGGAFILPLNGQTMPCLLQAKKGDVTLHGFAQSASRTNVTQLTDLIVAKALGSSPAAAFATFDSDKASAIKSALSAAATSVKQQLTLLGITLTANDPFTFPFVVGDLDDKVLDKIVVQIVATLKRGLLVESAATIATLTREQIDGGTTQSGLINISGSALCSVKFVALNYNTIGVKGEATNASGVLMLPSGTNSACASPAGLVAYAKGTDVQKPRTLANPTDGEAFLLAAMYASKGYAVVATDYLGFAKSAYPYHPYLHADSQATTIIDSIRAARLASALMGAPLSGKVMLTGYSQGGHASMAAHRAIERDHAGEINVVAGAHLAGPYNLSGSFKLPNAIAGYQYFVTYLVTAWQKVYGNIYASVPDAFKPAYATDIESLLPSPTLNFTTLVTTGKLPGALGETPDQARDALFQPAFITDSRTENSPLFLAGKKNDLLGWNPVAKTLLCGGSGDPVVPPIIHQVVAQADFTARGFTNVTSVDVDPSIRFVYGTNNAPPTDPAGAAAYYGNYHGSYEPPFCHAAARQTFDTVK